MSKIGRGARLLGALMMFAVGQGAMAADDVITCEYAETGPLRETVFSIGETGTWNVQMAESGGFLVKEVCVVPNTKGTAAGNVTMPSRCNISRTVVLPFGTTDVSEMCTRSQIGWYVPQKALVQVNANQLGPDVALTVRVVGSPAVLVANPGQVTVTKETTSKSKGK